MLMLFWNFQKFPSNFAHQFNFELKKDIFVIAFLTYFFVVPSLPAPG